MQLVFCVEDFHCNLFLSTDEVVSRSFSLWTMFLYHCFYIGCKCDVCSTAGVEITRTFLVVSRTT